MGANASARLQHDSGLFVPPSECTDGADPNALADLLPVIEPTYTVDGTLVAASYNVSTAVMMYDRKLWREAGLDPDDLLQLVSPDERSGLTFPPRRRSAMRSTSSRAAPTDDTTSPTRR